MASAAREDILSALRAARAPEAPLPAEHLTSARYPDPPARLAEAVAAVAGTLVRVADAAALRAGADALASRLQAVRVVSQVPGAGPGNVSLDALQDPHDLEGVDLAILPGVFAVAETGAIWVTGEGLRQRGVFVVAQHLALVVSARDIVNDMHEAYARLRFDGPGFGLFIAGPSKTADIEQALVIGAHGARSCTVFLVG